MFLNSDAKVWRIFQTTKEITIINADLMFDNNFYPLPKETILQNFTLAFHGTKVRILSEITKIIMLIDVNDEKNNMDEE